MPIRSWPTLSFFLLGSIAYQTFSAVWPQIKGDKYIDRLNGLKKLVVSRTLKEVAWNASLIAGDAATELAKVKQQRGGNIMKYGVTQLDQALQALGFSICLAGWPRTVLKGGITGCLFLASKETRRLPRWLR